MDEFRNAQNILFYVSYDNEVHTHEMIKTTLAHGKNVVVPFSDLKNKRIIPAEIHAWNDLAPGAYGILEPKKECIQEVDLGTIDFILAPGVAFDIHGHRIGHGMGYYDRLLQNSQNARHVGLAFELQIVKEIPVEKHDVAVDMIVTEKRILRCLVSR